MVRQLKRSVQFLSTSGSGRRLLRQKRGSTDSSLKRVLDLWECPNARYARWSARNHLAGCGGCTRCVVVLCRGPASRCATESLSCCCQSSLRQQSPAQLLICTRKFFSFAHEGLGRGREGPPRLFSHLRHRPGPSADADDFFVALSLLAKLSILSGAIVEVRVWPWHGGHCKICIAWQMTSSQWAQTWYRHLVHIPMVPRSSFRKKVVLGPGRGRSAVEGPGAGQLAPVRGGAKLGLGLSLSRACAQKEEREELQRCRPGLGFGFKDRLKQSSALPSRSIMSAVFTACAFERRTRIERASILPCRLLEIDPDGWRPRRSLADNAPQECLT